MIKSILIVGIGGFVGSGLRYIVTVLSRQLFHSNFPIGTFAVNVLGCFLIGIFFGMAEKSGWLSDAHLLLLATGFCGGFTTFSAFANEAFVLGGQGNWLLSGAYVIASIVMGIAAVWLGRVIINF